MKARFDFKHLTDEEWTEVLAQVERGDASGRDLAHNIVVLGKPLEPERIERAKEVVARHIRNADSWVRHEVLWFISWGNVLELTEAVIERLRNDVDPDNRAYAAVCLGRMWIGTTDRRVCRALAEVVVNAGEDTDVRIASYAALLWVAHGKRARPAARPFEQRQKEFKDVDQKWAVQFLS